MPKKCEEIVQFDQTVRIQAVALELDLLNKDSIAEFFPKCIEHFKSSRHSGKQRLVRQ